MYERLVRPIAFRGTRDDSERAHEAALGILRRVGRRAPVLRVIERVAAHHDDRFPQTLAGIEFSNPLGLAAGFDKNAVAVPALAALGFGFIEVGTVTPNAQAGNARPRVARLPASRSIVNRLGSPNDGADVVVARLAAYGSFRLPIGVSIGKSRSTPLEKSAEDYRAAFRAVAPLASYVSANISSPNTPGTRGLHDRVLLNELLSALREESETIARERGSREPTPVFLKISPDLSPRLLDAVLDTCLHCRIAGIIAANTLPVSGGGLSGPSLLPRMLALVREISQGARGKLVIIASGGISSACDALAAMCAGASLVQIYTAFVYGGPLFPKRVLSELSALLEHEEIPALADAVGRNLRRPA